jgi:ribosome maturation factor RimP
MGRGAVADDKELGSQVEELLGKAGLHLLEFSLSKRGGSVTAKAVVYSPSGTGTDECVRASRLILSQIQISCDIQNPSIEVSSPGIDRILRSDKDWKAFTGKYIKLILKDSEEWISGRLTSLGEDTIVFEGSEGPATIERSSIAKARLDSTHKGE